MLVVPDLDQDGPALFHDVGNPEPSADLDELAPGHDDLFPPGEFIEDEKDADAALLLTMRASSAPVRLADELFGEASSLAPGLLGQVIFQVAVSGERFRQGLKAVFAQGGPPQVCVHDDAGAVDDPLEFVEFFMPAVLYDGGRPASPGDRFPPGKFFS